MNETKEKNQNESKFLLNELLFANPVEEITIGLQENPSDDSIRTHYKALPEAAREFFPGCNEKNPFLYIQFAEPHKSRVKIVVRLSEHPAITRKYYTRLLLQYLKEKKYLTGKNFVKEPEVWIKEHQYDKYYSFAKYSLKVIASLQKPLPTLRIAFLGYSYILSDDLLQLGLTHPEATAAVTRVAYHRKVYAGTNRLPEEAFADKSKIFPVLNRKLAVAAGIVYPFRKDLTKHSTYLNKIRTFAHEHLLTDEAKKHISLLPEWQSLSESDTERLDITAKRFLFGKGQPATDIYTGLLNYGPYEALKQNQVGVFFIYHEDDAFSREKAVQYLDSKTGLSAGLSRFMKTSTYFDKEMDIVFHDKSQPLKEVLSAINGFSLKPEIGYLGIYLSPYGPFEATEAQHRNYYLIKEALLQRNIASQTIDRDKMMQAGSAFNYWIPNLAIAVIAKLGGVPWIPDKHETKDLITGFGLYATSKYNMRVVGSSVCFSNDGHFEELDFFPENENFRVAAALEKALRKYVSRHKDINRLVIHYYKEMSEKTFKPIREMIHRFKPGVPVIVIRMNMTPSVNRLVEDTTSRSRLPLNGSYFHLGNKHYLLYLNDCEDKAVVPKRHPMPVQLSLKSSDPDLLEDPNYVKGLMEQVYAFSNLYWRGIVQPPIPVTVNYPRMLAEDAVWFQRQTLPGGALKVPWFL
jgi:hypothetical protein